MTVLAVPRPQHEEGILAEEAVAGDALAAFDALQQEGVVGVLGDLEERRRRRQQVGEDLLVDGHERAARRQLREFFERRLLHTDVPASVLAVPRWAGHGRQPPFRSFSEDTRLRRHAGPPQELADGLRDEHVEAVQGAAAGGRRVAQQPRRPRVVDEVVDQRAVEITGVDRRSIDVGVRADRRRVDQQVPAAARHRPWARRHVRGVGERLRRLGPPGVHRYPGPARHEAADDRARRSAGADDRGAPALERLAGQRGEEAFDVGVGPVPPAGATPQRVERAALPRRPRRVFLERRGHAGAGDAERIREREKVVEVGRLARNVDAVDAGGREGGVVHGRRHRMADGPADDRVDRRGRADAADPELVAQPVDRDLAGGHAVAAVGPAGADVLGQDTRGEARRPHRDHDRALALVASGAADGDDRQRIAKRLRRDGDLHECRCRGGACRARARPGRPGRPRSRGSTAPPGRAPRPASAPAPRRPSIPDRRSRRPARARGSGSPGARPRCPGSGRLPTPPGRWR